MPFCIVTIAVSGPIRCFRPAAIGPTWCAFTVSSTMSCGPASCIEPTARRLFVWTSLPSSSISVMPEASIAARLERATTVTGTPERARRTAR